jgi:hypothetical protein
MIVYEMSKLPRWMSGRKRVCGRTKKENKVRIDERG